jgi:hypothetical protein
VWPCWSETASEVGIPPDEDDGKRIKLYVWVRLRMGGSDHEDTGAVRYRRELVFIAGVVVCI